MKLFLPVLILFLITFHVHGQTASAIPPNIRATNTLDRLSYMTPSDLLYGIPLPEKKLIGDAYLDLNWRSGSIMLYGTEKMLEGYPVRYDLLREEMEVKAKNGVKVIEGKKIKSFVWVDSLTKKPQYFINSKEYKSADDVALLGFYQIMADGKLPLFKNTDAVIKEANYSVQFDVGNRDDQILKKEKLFYAREGKVYPVPGSRKKLIAVFPDHQEEVAKFIRINALSLSDESHVEKIFQHYNSLNVN
jgi:hypothetical protein